MKITTYTTFVLLVLLNSCAFIQFIEKGSENHELVDLNTFKIEKTAASAVYAYSTQAPIKVGGAETNEDILNERRFLNALRGPNGEKVTYELVGSCCYYELENPTHSNIGLLDRYKVTVGDKEYILYFAPYESTKELLAPKGFTFVQIEA